MPVEPPDSVILGYIRANRGTYTREAIERELRDAGHAPESIADAWAASDAELAPAVPATASSRGSLRSPRFWLTWLLATLAIVLPVGGLALTGDSDLQGVGVLVWFGGLAVAMIAGLVMVFFRRVQLIGLGLLLAAATLLFIPFVALFIFVGYCFVQLAQNP